MLTSSLFSWLTDCCCLLVLVWQIDSSSYVLCKHSELRFYRNTVFVYLLGVRKCCVRDKLSLSNYSLFYSA